LQQRIRLYTAANWHQQCNLCKCSKCHHHTAKTSNLSTPTVGNSYLGKTTSIGRTNQEEARRSTTLHTHRQSRNRAGISRKEGASSEQHAGSGTIKDRTLIQGNNYKPPEGQHRNNKTTQTFATHTKRLGHANLEIAAGSSMERRPIDNRSDSKAQPVHKAGKEAKAREYHAENATTESSTLQCETAQAFNATTVGVHTSKRNALASNKHRGGAAEWVNSGASFRTKASPIKQGNTKQHREADK